MSPTDNVPGEQTDEAAVGRAAKIRATGRRELPPGPYLSTLRDGAGRVIRREEIQVTGDSQRIELGRSPAAPVRRIDTAPTGVPLLLDGLRAFRGYADWMPYPAGLLHFGGPWTAWEGAV